MEPEMGSTHQTQDKAYEILVELVGRQGNLFRCLKSRAFIEFVVYGEENSKIKEIF